MDGVKYRSLNTLGDDFDEVIKVHDFLPNQVKGRIDPEFSVLSILVK
jgi:hypothetical protein